MHCWDLPCHLNTYNDICQMLCESLTSNCSSSLEELLPAVILDSAS